MRLDLEARRLSILDQSGSHVELGVDEPRVDHAGHGCDHLDRTHRAECRKDHDRTIAPSMAVASAIPRHGVRSTSSATAYMITDPPRARIQCWVVPGARVRLYNKSQLDAEGRPQLVYDLTAPQSNAQWVPPSPYMRAFDFLDGAQGGFSARDLPQDRGAYAGLPVGVAPADWSRRLGAFFDAKKDGMVLMTIDLDKDDAWDVFDRFSLTQQSRGRLESSPAPVRLEMGRGVTAHHWKPPFVDRAKLELGCDRLESGELAVPPGAWVQLISDDLPFGEPVQADDDGRFTLSIAPDRRERKVAIRASVLPEFLPQETATMVLSGCALPWVDRIARWEEAMACARRTTVRGEHRIKLELDQLPPGYTLRFSNISSGESKTFKEVDGKLVIESPRAEIGDALSIEGPEMRDLPEAVKGRSFRIAATWIVPDAAQSSRIESLQSRFEKDGADTVAFALEVLGPFSPYPALRETPVCSAQEVLTGFALASYFRRLSYRIPNAVQRVEAFLEEHGRTLELEGFKAALATRAEDDARRCLHPRVEWPERGEPEVPHAPTAGCNPFFELETVRAEVRQRVIVGGYSPISGSHGPLRPASRTIGAVYALKVPCLPPLQLGGSGREPTGWINRSAMYVGG
jgi:hypothetical protein